MTDPGEVRSRTMRAVKSRDTGAEMAVRRLVHSLGYRYRLYRRDLPGVPDLVFPSRRAVIFVHGCFWHQHDCPRGARIPKTRQDYWEPKLQRNKSRDQEHCDKLRALGFRTLVIWECEVADSSRVTNRIQEFLDL